MTSNTSQRSGYQVHRYVVWSILALIYLIVFFHRMSVGVIREELMAEFQMTSGSFAALGSIYFYVYMFMQIPAGILADTLGARRTVMSGSILAGVGSVVFGLATGVPAAYAGRFLVGMGVSVVFIPILTLQSRWFREEEFGSMTGLTSFVGNLGSVLAQTPLAVLVGLFSWRATFLGIGLFSILLGGLCFLIVRDKPEDAGYPPVAKIPPRKERPKLAKAFGEVLKNRHSWAPSVLFFTIFGAQVAFTGTFGQQYLMGIYGFDKVEASKYTLICALSLAIGSVLAGKISDVISRRKPVAVGAAAANLAGWFLLAGLEGKRLPAGVLAMCMVLIGAGCSAVVLCFSIVKEVNAPEYVGISTSVVNIAGFAGAAILPVMVGNAFDRFSALAFDPAQCSQAFRACLLCAAVAMAAAFFTKETYCHNLKALPFQRES